MNFEIANPSDPYTFVAPSAEVASLVTFFLDSRGMCPAIEVGPNFERIEGGFSQPFFLGGGASQWFEEEFGRDLDASIEALRPELAEALESVMIGSPADRGRMERVVAAIENEDDRRRAREAWHDERRTSLNDIGGRARQIAARLREARVA